MRYTILGFSQEAVCSISKSTTDKNGKYKVLTLDVVDLLIIQEIADFMNRRKIIKYTIEDKTYFSIKYDAIIEDLPILGVKKQALRDRIDKMCELGVIEKQVIKDGTGSCVAFRLGDVYEDLKYKSTGGVCSGLHTGMYSTTHGCVADYTPNNYSTNTNYTITNNKEKENIKEKETKKKEVELPDYIAPEYRYVMTEWLEYKKERRETYKSRGLKQCYEKLVTFSNGNPDIALEIIHSAMSNNYSGFFPLRSTSQQTQAKLTPYEQQQLERKRYTAQFEQRIFDNINSLDDDEGAGCGRLPDDI